MLLFFLYASLELIKLHPLPISSESNMSTDTSPVQTFLLSPDIDTQDSSVYKESGFYLLRKDSERRQTMVRILEQDMDKVNELLISLFT